MKTIKKTIKRTTKPVTKKTTTTMSKKEAPTMDKDMDAAVRRELIKKGRNPSAGRKGLTKPEMRDVRRRVIDSKTKKTTTYRVK